MVKIAFDIGNVLCDVITDPFLQLLSETLNISIKESVRFLKKFQQLHDIGYTSMEDQLRDVYHIKSEVTINKLILHWNSSIVPNEDILDMLNRQKNLDIALLSNIGTEHAGIMDGKLTSKGKKLNFIKHYSCEVGARKPHKLFYQSFLSQYPEYNECLYIDDLQENLNMGEQFGFKPFLFSLKDNNFLEKIQEIETLIQT